VENLLLLVFCFAAGIVLRWSGRLPDNTPSVLNGFVIHLSLPALIILYVQPLPLDVAILYPVGAPWLLFLLSLCFFSVLQRARGWKPATTGGLVLTGGLANTSFVGLPMVEAFYGATFIGLAVLMDQLGTYLVLSTLGILVALMFSPDAAGNFSLRAAMRRVLAFPPFLALLLALALRPVEMSVAGTELLAGLGSTLAPLALLSVGYQLRLGDLAGRLEPLAWGLCFKLAIGPFLVGIVLVKALGETGPITQVTIFEIAMASQIGGAIVAMEHKLDPKLVTLMVGIGIPLSFITLPLWWYLLQSL
jgi:malate permease and related proteins